MSFEGSKQEKLQALRENDIAIDDTVNGGVRDMCNLSEIVWEKGKTEGRIEGKEEGKREVALNMLKQGFSVTNVALCSGISEEEVKKMLEDNQILC